MSECTECMHTSVNVGSYATVRKFIAAKIHFICEMLLILCTPFCIIVTICFDICMQSNFRIGMFMEYVYTVYLNRI